MVILMIQFSEKMTMFNLVRRGRQLVLWLFLVIALLGATVVAFTQLNSGYGISSWRVVLQRTHGHPSARRGRSKRLRWD